MFQQLKNIDTAFKHVRLLVVVVIITSTALCCFTLYKCHLLVTEIQGTIYILYNGKVLEAYATERKENIPVEARTHVALFHEYFFTLYPDAKKIQENISKALNLADISAKQQYDNLKENRYYSNIISGNISQEIQMDSIFLDLDQQPIYFRYYGTQRIIRATSTVIRSLVTEGYLRNLEGKSDDNSQGFLIERWNTLENQDLKTINR